MDLKQATLEVLSQDQLLWFVNTLEIKTNGHTRKACVEALMGQPPVTAADLLTSLYEADVKLVCQALGVSPTGRRKVLIERLEEAYRTALPGTLATQPAVPMPPKPPRRSAPPAQAISVPATAPAAPAVPAPAAKPVRPTFVAIDFETADQGRDSACAVALVRVEEDRIVHKVVRLIRPPRREIMFTYVHGLTWNQLKDQPTFAQVWPEICPILEGAAFLAAHNASFDKGVLEACCRAARLPVPPLPFQCTVQMARKAWSLFPTKLPNVCAHLGIALDHHEAGSDAEACARIVLAAHDSGHCLSSSSPSPRRR